MEKMIFFAVTDCSVNWYNLFYIYMER